MSHRSYTIIALLIVTVVLLDNSIQKLKYLLHLYKLFITQDLLFNIIYID